MKKTTYIAPAIVTTEIKLFPLMEPSVTHTGGDAGVGIADPGEEIPGTAQGRRHIIWEEDEDYEYIDN